MRRAARIILAVISLLSFVVTCIAAHGLWSSGTPRYFVLHGPERLFANVGTEVAQMDPQTVDAKLHDQLEPEPRNWMVIDSMLSEIARAELPMPPRLINAVNAARVADQGVLKGIRRCGRCMANASNCSLENLILCRAPYELTPLSDVAGVASAALDWTRGNPIDQPDLALSILGLGSTGALIATGGSSGTVKVGAALAKTARNMGRLPSWLNRRASDAFRTGFKWDVISEARNPGDLKAAVNVAALQPIARSLADVARLRTAIGIPSTIFVLSKTSQAQELNRIAQASEVLGDRTVGLTELLGTNRVIRASLRYSEEVIALVGGLVGFLGSLLMLLLSLGSNTVLAALRRAARRAGK